MVDCDYHGRCITIIGTMSIQPYIFHSNKLKEMIGASYLVNHWLDEGLTEAMQIDRAEWDAACKREESSGLSTNSSGEVVYIGGGNAVLLFTDKIKAKKAVFAWSRRVLEEAPGLRFAVGYAEVKDSLINAYQKALSELFACENALPFGSPLLGLPVVRTCATTGLPATDKDASDNKYISCESKKKRESVGSIDSPGPARQKMNDKFEPILQKAQKQQFAWKFEELGGEEGKSHIAVIHADGNSIGNLIQKIVTDSQDNRSLVQNLRMFSASLKKATHTAFDKTFELLANFLLYLKPEQQPTCFRTQDGIFPVTPIVYGGDDLTFVCDGRIGIPLAAYYLEEFKKLEVHISSENKFLTSCAGVAIVPTKFPFSRAYHLAEELCQNAKSARRKNDDNGSWLDFHIAMGGITSSLTRTREQYYQSQTGDILFQRPYQITDNRDKWKEFINIIGEFKELPRSRVKNLRQALSQGPIRTSQWLTEAKFRGFQLPKVKSDSIVSIRGWSGGDSPGRQTPYFDPLEALDFYMDLPSLVLSKQEDRERKDS